jgi:hypothetical protein
MARQRKEPLLHAAAEPEEPPLARSWADCVAAPLPLATMAGREQKHSNRQHTARPFPLASMAGREENRRSNPPNEDESGRSGL